MPWTWPVDKAIAVPTNMRIAISWPGVDRESLELVNQSDPDVRVPARIEQAGSLSHQLWLVPEFELNSQSSYRLDWRASDGDHSISFMTNTGPDHTRPVFSSANIQGDRLHGACDRHIAASINVTNPVDDTTSEDALLVEVTLDDPRLETASLTIYVQHQYPFLGTGDGDNCLINVLSAQPGRNFQATIKLLDQAANASSASEPVTFRFQDNEAFDAGGCNTAGSTWTELVFLVFSLLLVGLFARGR
jgi:hypothetical protein